jgi:hypothetical protein
MLARFLLGSEPGQRWVRAALLGAALLGVGLRVFNYAVHPPSLWQDEAYWAIKAIKTAAIDAQIRPLGFMLLTQALLRGIYAAGWVYRLMPFAFSLVSMVLAPYVARRLFRGSGTQVLSVLLLALSPVALEMAVEFKHYGVEVGVYVAVLAALLNHVETRSRKSLATLLAVSWVGFFFSLTIIFLYPAVFGVLLWQAFRAKQWRWLAASAAMALVCLGTITTIYFTTWRTIKTAKAENKWGNSYDVFYIKDGPKTKYGSRLSWSTAKYFELAAAPGVGRAIWGSERTASPPRQQLAKVDWALWSALHLAGIAFLVRRRRFVELLLLWTPLLFLTAFNLAGRWPAGAFRTNTFYTPFSIFLACFAAEWLLALPARLRALTPALLALLLLPTLYFRPGIVRKGLWAKPGDFTAALDVLPVAPAKSERTLIMDFESCRPWEYYTEYDEPTRARGKKLARNYKRRCLRQGRKLGAEVARIAQPGRGFWMILTDPRKYEYVQAAATKHCQKTDVSWIAGETHMVLHCHQGK